MRATYSAHYLSPGFFVAIQIGQS